MRTSWHTNRDAVLITEAPLSAAQEFSNRRRRYLVMMFGRAVCVIGAVLTFHTSGWLAAAFLVGAAVLPWAAVLLANNSPAKQSLRFRRFLPATSGPAQLTAPDVGPPGSSSKAYSGGTSSSATYSDGDSSSSATYSDGAPTAPGPTVAGENGGHAASDPRIIDL